MSAWNGYFSTSYGLHGPCTESVSSVGLQEEAQAGSPGLLATAPRPRGATHAGPDSIITRLRDWRVVVSPLPIDNQKHRPVQGRDRQDAWLSIWLGGSSLRPPRWPSGKAFASRAGDPGFESRLRRDFFGVESYQWLKHWHSSGYPARRLAL